MSKRRQFVKVAEQAGILSFSVTYERQAKAYAIRITVPLENDKVFTDPAVGVYTTAEAAQEQIADDLLRFLERYPSAWESVTLLYQDVTQAQHEAALSLGWEMLEGIANADLRVLRFDHQAAAQAILDEVASLRDHPPQRGRVAKGTYSSRLPDQPKKPIAWQQPDARQHPVYTFEITCPYCGAEVTLGRHSPREPRHCGAETCQVEHERLLARERKRRQRARQQSE